MCWLAVTLLSWLAFTALDTAGIAFGTALGDFGLYTGDGSKGFGARLRVSVSTRLARCVGLGSAWLTAKLFSLEGVMGADFADAGIALIGDFSFETAAAAASAGFFRGVGTRCVALTWGSIYVFFFEFWHMSCVLICIRGPLARAVIAELLAGHAGGIDRVEAISAA